MKILSLYLFSPVDFILLFSKDLFKVLEIEREFIFTFSYHNVLSVFVKCRIFLCIFLFN